MHIDNEGLHDSLLGAALARLTDIEYERVLGEVDAFVARLHEVQLAERRGGVGGAGVPATAARPVARRGAAGGVPGCPVSSGVVHAGRVDGLAGGGRADDQPDRLASRPPRSSCLGEAHTAAAADRAVVVTRVEIEMIIDVG